MTATIADTMCGLPCIFLSLIFDRLINCVRLTHSLLLFIVKIVIYYSQSLNFVWLLSRPSSAAILLLVHLTSIHELDR